MKGFKNSTKTQSGHGFDEVPTRPATSRDLAAAKAVRIITPGKPTPRVTDSMILGKGEDKAPGERGARRFANGGQVTPRNRVSFDEAFDDKNAYRTDSPQASTSKQTFKQAFAANRAAGKETFVWNGKRYTTELADSNKPKSTAPQASTSPKVDRPVAPTRAPTKSVPVASKDPLVSAAKPTRVSPNNTFRENFALSMGDDSPAAKARLDAKANARGKALSDAVNFVLKGDGKPHPSFRENFQRSMGSDKPKRFAVGGLVPPVASGGMPALGQPLTSTNVNDARVRPVRQPNVVKPRDGGLPQAWRDSYAADRARRLGSMPAQETRSTGKPAERTGKDYVPATVPVPRSYADNNSGKDYVPATVPVPKSYADRAPSDDYDDMAAARSSGALDRFSANRGYKKGGKVVEKGSKEVYASKAAMKKHEASEPKAKERAEHKQEGGELLAGRAQSLRDMTGKPSGRPGYAKGGKSRWS